MRISKSDTMVFVKGAAMGTAEIIPGVSGSTIAVIVGIYKQFILLINDLADFAKCAVELLFGRIKKSEFREMISVDYRFAVALFSGMFLAIILLSNILSYILHDFPEYLFAFLMGLVFVSAIFLFLDIGKIRFRYVLIAILSALILMTVLSISKIRTVEDPSFIYLLIAGILASAAFTLPGVSGSFVLLLLGLYEYVLLTIKSFTHLAFSVEAFTKIFVLGVGVLIGLAVSSKILKTLFATYPGYIKAVLAGLMIGSIRVINPISHKGVDNISMGEIVLLFFMIILGGLVVFVVQRRNSAK